MIDYPAPGSNLTFEDTDFVTYTGPLWRIANTAPNGAYPLLAWHQLREYGPVAWCRWEPHVPPPRTQPDRGVLYAGTTLRTAVMERWQLGRRIDPYTGAPELVRFTPIEPLALLDLTADGTWAVRNEAGNGLTAGTHAQCSRWARAIVDQNPNLHGLLTPSTGTGFNVTIFQAGAHTIPVDQPDQRTLATDPAALAVLAIIRTELGYTMEEIDP